MDLPTEERFRVLCEITRAQHFAWREAALALAPQLDPVELTKQMWKLTGVQTAKAYLRRLDKSKPLAPQVARCIAWSSACMGEDVTVEKAARAMIDEKIGSLLVMRNDELAGIVTDTDMLQAVTDLLGWRQPGVRVTVQVPDEKGRLAGAAAAIAQTGGLLLASSSYTPPEPLRANIVFKVRNVPVDDLAAALRAVPGLEILDLREA